jgi:predicted alpha/beta-hydrolase family hydrolase
MRLSPRQISTPLGPARVHVARASALLSTGLSGELPGGTRPRGTLLLGHGAGGGIGAADLQAVARRALADGWTVALVEQPWRVAGRKVATPPPQLDVGWTAVVEGVDRGRARLPRPFVFGGRSAGARVACRLAGPLGAAGVVALAFPLHPPGRPERSRLAELVGAVEAGVPVLVVQGERDPFGSPAELRAALAAGLSAQARRGGGPGRRVPQVHLAVQLVAVPGDHGLKGSAGAAADAVQRFLADVSA